MYFLWLKLSCFSREFSVNSIIKLKETKVKPQP